MIKMERLATFDFDDTLTMPVYSDEEERWKTGLQPNEKTISIMKKLKSKGFKIHIVTSRRGSSENKNEISMFVKQHNLPVEDVSFTNLNFKADTLEKMGSVLHFDDDPWEIERIEKKNIKVVKIPHPAD